MNRQVSTHVVDPSAIKVSNVLTIVCLLTAFVLNSWPLVTFVTLVNLLGAAVPELSLFKQIYLRLLKPSRLVKPDVQPDNPEPHRFALAVSGLCTAISAALLFFGVAAGWAFSWLVIFLACLNVFVCFCAGCFMYHQLHRLGVPGFKVAPVRSGR